MDRTPRNYVQTVSVLAALGFERVLAAMTVRTSVDAGVFPTYLTQVLLPQLCTGAIVLCDHLQLHLSCRNSTSHTGCGSQVSLPAPYLPDLSPIELCWSKLKQLLRSAKARTYDPLAQPLAEVFAQLPEADAAARFAHCALFY